MIGRLENSVSMIQTAVVNLEKIKGWLRETRRFLTEEAYRSFQAAVPVSVINNYIGDRLARIRVTAETASFKGRGLLNGESGVKGTREGDGLIFVRGSARARSSGPSGYPIALYQSPRPATLTGAARLEPAEIERESLIVIADESHEARYQVRGDEDPQTLVSNLWRFLNDNGFDISVYTDHDNRLFLKHNQLGSKGWFKGLSYQSRLLSDIPGEYEEAEAGVDIEGTIGSERATGEGGFLTGDRGNPNTEGVTIYYDGELDRPGQVVGRVRIEQNGIKVPVDVAGEKVEILSIPSLNPDTLAIGVPNQGGFQNLGSIRADTARQCRDALKLIDWSEGYATYLIDELKRNESAYVDRAVDLLRSTMAPKVAGEDIVYLSKEKAKGMAGELRGMLGQAVSPGVSSWR